MTIISVRQNPEYRDRAILFFQEKWGSPESNMVYTDCITHCIGADNPLPQWYLLMNGDTIAGGAGLVTNDFISRMDLYPWFVALFIEESERGHAYGRLLMERAMADAGDGGFTAMYLSTDLVGYYEKYGFTYIGTGYHPWGEKSRIYAIAL